MFKNQYYKKNGINERKKITPDLNQNSTLYWIKLRNKPKRMYRACIWSSEGSKREIFLRHMKTLQCICKNYNFRFKK